MVGVNKMRSITDRIKKLPQNPGVYFFKGAGGEVLYIGKATNLRSRVSSYFRESGISGRSEWIGKMVTLVENIDFQETDSVLEALILESNLIKKYQPKYNTDEKDDKSFSYFVVTKEEFPRVIIVRGTDLAKMQNAKIKMQNDNAKIKNEKILDTKYHVPYTNAYGPYTSKYQMQTALKIIRRIFPFHALRQKSEKGCLDYQLGMCPGPYDGAISKEDYKKNIRGIKMILEGKKKRLITTLEKEMKEVAKKEEFEKAADLRNKIFALQHIRDIALINKEFGEDRVEIEKIQKDTLSQILNLKSFRIEAYDISNISGEHAVGSMVVFAGGKPDKSQYRKFKIKTVEGSNDVAMMREVLLRRFKNNWDFPDLILLDGGQGHVNMFSDLVIYLGLDVLGVAIAKGVGRKNLNFQFPISNKISMSQFPKEIQNFLNDKNLLKHIMDEAHRFAIGYHRKLRRGNAFNEK